MTNNVIPFPICLPGSGCFSRISQNVQISRTDDRPHWSLADAKPDEIYSGKVLISSLKHTSHRPMGQWLDTANQNYTRQFNGPSC